MAVRRVALAGWALAQGLVVAVLSGASAAELYDPATGVPTDTSLAKGILKDWTAANQMRAALAARGIFVQAVYTADGLANVAGGLKRTANYAGRLELATDIYMDRLLGPDAMGGALAKDRVHVNVFAIQGLGITAKAVGSLASISNIEAMPDLRLFEAWYDHVWGPWSLRFGQIGVDSEHATSATAGQFSNGTFGWPVLAAANLPSGGAAYPLATPAVRLKYTDPGKAFEWQAAVFNGDPAKPGWRPPQDRDRHGLDVRLRGGAYFVSEINVAVPGVDDASVKVGAWGHSGCFNDQRRDAQGQPIAVSGETGRRHRGNYGVYGGVDMPVPGLQDVSAFVRAFWAPGDRNLVGRQMDVGLVRKGILADKDTDALGIAVSVAQISSGARGYDTDAVGAGLQAHRRKLEGVLEANYSYQVTDGWMLQPNIQYIFHPGGGVADPSDPTGSRSLRNATVLSLRSQWKF